MFYLCYFQKTTTNDNKEKKTISYKGKISFIVLWSWLLTQTIMTMGQKIQNVSYRNPEFLAMSYI